MASDNHVKDNADDILLEGNDSDCDSVDGNVLVSDEVKCFEDETNKLRKTRANSKGLNNADNKTPMKGLKRKAAKSNSSSKVTKKPRTFTDLEVSELRSKMGIDAISNSLTNMDKMLQIIVNNPSVIAHVAAPVEKQQVENRPLVPLEPTFDNDMANDINFDYLNDSPMASESVETQSDTYNTSFNPSNGFNSAFHNVTEVNVNSGSDNSVQAKSSDVQEISAETPNVQKNPQESLDSNAQQGGNSNKVKLWQIPQTQADEKTGPSIDSALADAVNAALTVRSNAESLKAIRDKYVRPSNCANLVCPKVNKEIWLALPEHVQSLDNKFQETQRSFAKGLVPIVHLAEKCCRSDVPLDISETRTLLSDSLCLLGNAFLGVSQRRKSLIRHNLNDKFKPICNSDVPVDNFLFSSDFQKHMKELGDYTKIPIGIPKKPAYKPTYQNYTPKDLNSRGPAYMQGPRYIPQVRGRARGHRGYPRGYPRGQRPPPRNNYSR